MPIYRGINKRTAPGGFLVTKDDNPLSPGKSQKLFNHSPNGFSWGYGGSGPAQLALALLLEETTQDRALHLYQEFKWQVIAKLPMTAGWVMESDYIQGWIASKEAR